LAIFVCDPHEVPAGKSGVDRTPCILVWESWLRAIFPDILFVDSGSITQLIDPGSVRGILALIRVRLGRPTFDGWVISPRRANSFQEPLKNDCHPIKEIRAPRLQHADFWKIPLPRVFAVTGLHRRCG
jgi:hypothetical protein